MERFNLQTRFLMFFVFVFLVTSLCRRSHADASNLSIQFDSKPGSRARHVMATVVLTSSVERVWEALTRYEDYGLNNAFLEVKRVEDVGLGAAEVTMKIGLPKPFPKLSCVLRFSEDRGNYRINLVREQGCFERTSGTIAINKNEDGTLATLQLDFEPGVFFPDWALRMGIDRIIPTEIARIEKAARQSFAALD